MKSEHLTLILFVLSLLTSCQSEKLAYEPESIKVDSDFKSFYDSTFSPSISFVEGKIESSYEIIADQSADYYISVWIEAPMVNGDFYDYSVKLNGIDTGLSFKPTKVGFQEIILTQGDNTPF